MKKNRLVYIEPNDIAKEKLRNASPNLTNVVWDAEDYNIYVDLQVVCPNRDDCGQETVGLGNNNYISLLEGVKLNSHSEVGNLTTSFTDISYSEIKNNSVSDKEALGITSIDITFDAHFYPKVNINFTDVRAYSLFMPAEESYKEGLKTKAYETIDEDTGNRLYDERGRTYTNFFSSLFHFPYPCFLLTVKGFYGTKVTFRLAVDTFKSALNSSTGNFDVSISFIGYMFGLYTDIPMSYVLCAPYVGELDYSLEEGSLVRSKYWNQRIADGAFKTKQGETIPTFLEFAQRYSTILNEINQDSDLGEHANSYNNHRSYISKLNEIENLAKSLLNDIVLKETGVVTNGEFKNSLEVNNNEEKNYTFYFFTKNNENDGEITFTLNANKVKELHDTIKNANLKYKELNGDYHIEQFDLSELTLENTDVIKCSVVSKIDDYIDINKTNVPTIKINGSKTYTYIHNENEDNFLKGIKNKYSGSTIYVCAIKTPSFLKKLNDLKILADKNSEELRESAISDTEAFFSRELGFTPNIENVFRMIFAHLECFCNSYMKETLGSIRDIRSTRTLGYLGVKKENTDVQSRDDESKTFAPPFFALYNNKREITYPGSSSNATLRSIHEVKLVDSYIQAAKTFGEDYNKVTEYIQQMSVSNYYEETNEVNGFDMGLPISYNGGFSPVSPYDAFYGNRNPYSFLQNTNKIEDILYHFLLRLYSSNLLGLNFNNATKTNDYIDTEVKNILAVFPNFKKEDITNFIQKFTGTKNDVIIHLLKPSGNNETKRLINIEGILEPKNEDPKLSKCLPYIGDYRNGMLLVRFNSSLTYGDDEKQTEINKNVYNSLYNFKGINILESSAYDIFKKTKDAIVGKFANDIKIEDETGEEEKGELNVIYSNYEQVNDTTFKLAVSDEQILSETEAVKYQLPFVLSYGNTLCGNGLNILTDNNFQTHDNIYGKAFVLLMGLVGARLAMAEGPFDIFIGRELSIKVLENNISLTKYAYTLFYGSIIYALKKYVNEGIEIYPNIFKKEEEDGTIYFKDIYTSNGFVKTSFVKHDGTDNTIERKGDRLTNLAIKIVNVSNKKNREKELKSLNETDLIDIFNDETFVLEENFIIECEPGGLLYNILQTSQTESGNTENVYRLEIDNKIHLFNDVTDSSGKTIGINIFKKDSNTSKNLALLMSKSVCVLNTQYTKDDNIGINEFNNVIYNKLLKKLEEQYEPSEEKIEKIEAQTEEISADRTVSEHSDLQKSLYYTMKNLYDKWICSYGNIERFLLGSPEDDYNEVSKRFENNTRTNSIKEINNFIFVDSFYRDIGSDFMCNPMSIIELITMSIEGNNFSVYQFMHELCVKNCLLMRALPVYNNFYTPDSLKEIFKPNNVFNLSNAQEDGFSSTYLIMYTHQPSVHLDEGDNKKIGYINDSFDIGDTIVLNEFEDSTDTNNKNEKKIRYSVPAFGVTYAAQNQSYFKNININMDNPITTDYSIMNQLQLSQTAASGDLNHPVGIGQNIYSIYSNRSYNCTVEMMGCANIMPMMYFQLNNIPMFKGAYMIVSVKHSIKAGNMTTTFTGVRQSRILYPIKGSSLILTSLMDRLNGPIKSGKSGENLIIGDSIQYQANTVPIEIINSNISFHTKSLLSEFKWVMHASKRKYPLIYRSNRVINKIILHYTAGTSSEAKDSVDNSNAFIMAKWWNEKWNTNGTYEASADFGVDDKYVVQFNPDIDRYSSFACKEHADKISIEMCSTFDQSTHPFNGSQKLPNMPQWKFTDKVLENTKQLILSLYKKYNKEIPLSTHYLETGKSCPGIKGWNGNVLRDEKGTQALANNNQEQFEAFKKEIHEAWLTLSKTK